MLFLLLDASVLGTPQVILCFVHHFICQLGICSCAVHLSGGLLTLLLQFLQPLLGLGTTVTASLLLRASNRFDLLLTFAQNL